MSKRAVEDDIGPRLRRHREERQLSLRELARRLGISPSAISQFETGKSQALGEHALRDGDRAAGSPWTSCSAAFRPRMRRRGPGRRARARKAKAPEPRAPRRRRNGTSSEPEAGARSTSRPASAGSGSPRRPTRGRTSSTSSTTSAAPRARVIVSSATRVGSTVWFSAGRSRSPSASTRTARSGRLDLLRLHRSPLPSNGRHETGPRCVVRGRSAERPAGRGPRGRYRVTCVPNERPGRELGRPGEHAVRILSRARRVAHHDGRRQLSAAGLAHRSRAPAEAPTAESTARPISGACPSSTSPRPRTMRRPSPSASWSAPGST